MKQLIVVLLWVTSFQLMAQKTVENGRTAQNSHTLVFTEDLTFGGTDEEWMLWVDSRTKIVPDTRGYMYVTDPKENVLLEFDPDGKFVRVAAKKGQGPGELQGIRSFTILDNNEGVMLDGPPISVPKIKIFDESRKVIKEDFLRAFGFPAVFWPSPDGKLAGSIYNQLSQSDNKIITQTGIINQNLEVVKVVRESKQNRIDPSRAREGAYWSQFLAELLNSLFEGFGVIAFAHDNHVYTAVSNTYEITKWRPDLSEKVLVVKRQYKPIPNNEGHIDAIVDIMSESFSGVPFMQEVLTRPVLQKAVSLAEPPPAKNPVFGIIPMEDGGFLVVHDVDLGTGHNLADIYSAEGQFLGQTSMEGFGFMGVDGGYFIPRMIFRNGFAYTILTDEYGENRAVRYTYRLGKKES